jgi:hypothetical protein
MNPARLALGAAGVGIGIAAVVALREATLTTHQRVEESSTLEVVITARDHGSEAGQTLDEMVNALVLSCRLRVTADPEGTLQEGPDGRYVAVLSPSLDTVSRTEFRGCLEDWEIDHLQVSVHSMTTTHR